MKFNKKITVTALSTVLGLGLVGSISGAVAWYQYSTRATSSVVGTSVGRGGTLQVKKAGTSTWARDLHSDTLIPEGFKGFKPVTFGGFGGEGNEALPAQAYLNPQAGKVNMKDWTKATANVDYLQYTLNFQAKQLNNNTHDYVKVAYPVYLTDILLKGLNIDSEDTREDEDITAAIRVHISVAGGSNYLLAPAAGTLDTYGKLDLDGDGAIDKIGGYEWATGANTDAEYGEYNTAETPALINKTQTFIGPSSLLAGYETNGKIKSTDAGKAIGSTTTTGDDLTVTFTIWNEGWAQLDASNASINPTGVKSMWDPTKRDGVKFRVGFTFDIGDVFQDAYPAA